LPGKESLTVLFCSWYVNMYTYKAKRPMATKTTPTTNTTNATNKDAEDLGHARTCTETS
jgi:hypothetical protein